MYAVIESGGKQYRVAPGAVIRVEKLAAEPGAAIDLPRVLLLADDAGVEIGAPVVAGAQVKAKVRAHGRGPKVQIFKMRRRKHYRRSQGHRQSYTELEITDIKR